MITFMAGAMTAAGQTSEPVASSQNSDLGYFKHLDVSVNLGTFHASFPL